MPPRSSEKTASVQIRRGSARQFTVGSAREMAPSVRARSRRQLVEEI